MIAMNVNGILNVNNNGDTPQMMNGIQVIITKIDFQELNSNNSIPKMMKNVIGIKSSRAVTASSEVSNSPTHVKVYPSGRGPVQ